MQPTFQGLILFFFALFSNLMIFFLKVHNDTFDKSSSDGSIIRLHIPH